MYNEAEIYKEIKQGLLAGASLSQIADHLNQIGYTSKTGLPWTFGNVSNFKYNKKLHHDISIENNKAPISVIKKIEKICSIQEFTNTEKIKIIKSLI